MKLIADHHHISTEAAYQMPYDAAMQTLHYYHLRSKHQHQYYEFMKRENERK